MDEYPCEFINVTPVNPLISKCQIKVCYVSDKPNRNKSIITKDVARELANSLPGSPIVGFYNEGKGDFEEHNRTIDISNGKFTIKDTTQPYGFVDLGAKVWFQKFLDDGANEREYLMTEGYLWTGQYPEAQRIIDEGNNQSMELDEKYLDAYWTKDGNGKRQFFIINEAIISKLCILGADVEPCFEGASISKLQFSFEDGFKDQLFSMMKEMKEILEKGGESKMNTYTVEIGDALWNALYSYIDKTYSDNNSEYPCSIYRIEGIYEDAGQKFAILQSRSEAKYFKMNFSWTEEGFSANDLEEVTKSYTPVEKPQFSLADVEAFELEFAKKKKADDEEEKPADDKKDNGDGNEPEEKCPECGKPKSECTCEKEDKKKKYTLEEIPEYVELSEKYSTLETQFSALNDEKSEWETEKARLESEIATLSEFKLSIEKKEKEAMIAKFYMLSDEDKKDVTENINTYSLDDIEAKLSVICVRNKVSFNLDDDNDNPETDPVLFNLNGGSTGDDDDSMPAWIRAVSEVAKELN